MEVTVRQFSDLVEGDLVAEHHYSSDDPANALGILKLVLHNCSLFLKQERIHIVKDSLELKKIEFTYPGGAGRLEVTFQDEYDGPQ